MEDSHANHWQATISCASDVKYIRQQNTCKNHFQWKSIITNKKEYLNILNELLELPSMPDIVELDVILADGEQWKSDIE